MGRYIGNYYYMLYVFIVESILPPCDEEYNSSVAGKKGKCFLSVKGMSGKVLEMA